MIAQSMSKEQLEGRYQACMSQPEDICFISLVPLKPGEGTFISHSDLDRVVLVHKKFLPKEGAA